MKSSIEIDCLKRLKMAAQQLDTPSLYGRELVEAQATYYGELSLIAKQWGLYQAGNDYWKCRVTRRLDAEYPGWRGSRRGSGRKDWGVA